MKGSLDILWYARWSCKWSFDSLIGDQRSIIVWLLFLRTQTMDDDEVVAREQVNEFVTAAQRQMMY